MRSDIESVLREGESLSQFVEAATLQAARRRKVQDEFLARDRASLAKAKLSGELFAAEEVLSGLSKRLIKRLSKRLDKRLNQHVQALRPARATGAVKASAAVKV